MKDLCYIIEKLFGKLHKFLQCFSEDITVRLHLQKNIFLLQELYPMQTGLSYGFIWHLKGVCSRNLVFDTYEVKEEFERNGKKYLKSKNKNHINSIIKDYKEKLSGYYLNVRKTNLLSAIAYIHRSGMIEKKEIANEIKRLYKIYDDKEICEGINKWEHLISLT